MASVKIIVTQPAEDDVNEIVHFLEANWSPELAIKFFNAFYKSLDTIELAPKIGVKSQKAAGVRKKPADNYNAVYYEVIGDTIYILRVIDIRSNPDANPY